MYQSLIICALDQISSVIYVAMNYMTLPPITTIIAQFFWQSAHAFPVFTYLTMNATIRRGFFNIFKQQAEPLESENAGTTTTPHNAINIIQM
ncbi:unnamed protein product [Caenorhabditis angaria]|uniref:Serpentine receptor class gamma n=1 Tax=Caenorhabditis angaria TaxID=860376 RepID=A0A9P1N9D6_9PELO|nr:unnamed protein product [Caenorhabditis angaria]